MKLKEYNKKRNFNNTTEPKGKILKNKKNMLKFVIQYHQARAKHYDFRLEWQGVLLSWAVPKGLSENPKDKRLAVMVEDHPLDYATFEGIIPKGNYGAGSVEIFDKGFYVPSYSVNTGLKKGHISFTLFGEKLKGGWELVKMGEKNWLIIKSNDEFAVKNSNSLIKKLKNSNKLPFKTCDVQLATLSHKIPRDKNWLFEIKYDGYRIIAFMQNGKVKLVTRNNKDFTKKFESITKSLENISQENVILDGEIVCFDENGRSDFGLLQNNIKFGKSGFYYAVFDILALNGQDLRNKPLKERKEILEKVLAKKPDNIIVSTFVVGKGKESFNLAKKMNLEGIIAKDLNSTYSGKRTEDWLKIKCYLRQEFVIGGYTVTDKNKYVSAILLGYYNKNKLIYVGKVGTGLTEQQKVSLSKQFKKLKVNDCQFNKEFKNETECNWLKPELVAEIQYVELTKDNILRQPSFIGLRQDKNPKDIILETGNED